jgi:hypothetical protein
MFLIQMPPKRYIKPTDSVNAATSAPHQRNRPPKPPRESNCTGFVSSGVKISGIAVEGYDLDLVVSSRSQSDLIPGMYGQMEISLSPSFVISSSLIRGSSNSKLTSSIDHHIAHTYHDQVKVEVTGQSK